MRLLLVSVLVVLAGALAAAIQFFGAIVRERSAGEAAAEKPAGSTHAPLSDYQRLASASLLLAYPTKDQSVRIDYYREGAVVTIQIHGAELRGRCCDDFVGSFRDALDQLADLVEKRRPSVHDVPETSPGGAP